MPSFWVSRSKPRERSSFFTNLGLVVGAVVVVVAGGCWWSGGWDQKYELDTDCNSCGNGQRTDVKHPKFPKAQINNERSKTYIYIYITRSNSVQLCLESSSSFQVQDEVRKQIGRKAGLTKFVPIGLQVEQSDDLLQ